MPVHLSDSAHITIISQADYTLGLWQLSFGMYVTGVL